MVSGSTDNRSSFASSRGGSFKENVNTKLLSNNIQNPNVDQRMKLPEDAPSSMPAPGIKAFDSKTPSEELSSMPNQNDINGSVRMSESHDPYSLNDSSKIEPLL